MRDSRTIVLLIILATLIVTFNLITYEQSRKFQKKVPESRFAIDIEPIRLNVKSELFSSIQFINHHPHRREIAIHFKPDARCPRPILRGRLSGRTLAIIEWEWDGANILKGYYSIPTAGEYFIEIIVLFCQYSKHNFENCMVTGDVHRVTKPGTSIQVNKPVTISVLGYWKSDVHLPLPTRWQPTDCRRNFDDKKCIGSGSSGNLSPFKRRYKSFDFSFRLRGKLEERYNRWMVRYDEIPFKFHRLFTPKTSCYNIPDEVCDLCVVGDSHSRRLFASMKYAVELQRVGYAKFMYPEEIDENVAKHISRQCNTVLLAFGQWDILHHRISPEEFGAKMRTMLSNFKGHSGVYVRSLHYNSLGVDKMVCPPIDNRSPTRVDEYNFALKQVVDSMNIPWIDTRSIDGPVWDTASDYNHFSFIVEVVQAFYFGHYFHWIH